MVEGVEEAGEEVGVEGARGEEGALDVIEADGGGGEEVEGVLLLLLDDLGGDDDLGLDDLLAGGGLLVGGDRGGAADLEDVGLVGDGDEEALDGGVLGLDDGVEDVRVEELDRAEDGEVGDGDLGAEHEGVLLEVGVEDGEGLEDVGLGAGVGLLVEGGDVVVGEEEGDHGGLDLASAEVDPLLAESLLVEVVTVEVDGAVHVGDVGHDGVGLVDGALGGLEGGDLAEGELSEELGGLVGLAHDDGDDLDLLGDASVLGGDERLEGTEVGGVSVDLLSRRKSGG